MATATLQLGRLRLREEWVHAESVDNRGQRSVTLSGQESPPRVLAAALPRARDDILGLAGSVLPCTFTVKNYLDGFYQINETQAEVEDWKNGLLVVRWSLGAVRLGSVGECDLESRLSGAVTRSNAFAATGERSHAPALGSSAYWAGAAAPTAVDRPCSDGGSVRVYRGLGATINPRWANTPSGLLGGRVRFLDETGRERAGTMLNLSASGAWTLTNGILRVTRGAGGATFAVGVWDTGAWQDTAYLVRMDNPYVTIDPFDYLTVLVNDLGAITLRFTRSLNPGRFHCDVTLRRGSRVVELYLQNEYSTQLKVVRAVAAASTQASGYVVASANDAAGNKGVVGSAKSFTADTVNGGLEKVATLTLDAMVGCVLDGSGALAGDAATDLYAQYLGMPGEQLQVVKR